MADGYYAGIGPAQHVGSMTCLLPENDIGFAFTDFANTVQCYTSRTVLFPRPETVAGQGN